MKIVSAVFPIALGKPHENVKKMIALMDENPADVYLFPAYVLTGRTCGQLFSFKTFQALCDSALDELCAYTEDHDVAIVTSADRYGNLYITDGTYAQQARFTFKGKSIAVSSNGEDRADVVLIPTAMPSYPCIQNDILEYCAAASRQKNCVVAVANAGFGESSADDVFKGFCGVFRHGVISDFKAQDLPETVIAQAEDSKESGIVYQRPNRQADDRIPYYGKNEPSRYLNELFLLQTQALYTRLMSSGIKKIAVNVSGGLDSTMALLVAEAAMKMAGYPATDIVALTLPSFPTSDRTKQNAHRLMQALGVTALEIPIGPAVEQHLRDIGHATDVYDVTYENAQARERAQILFDVANMHNALALGTGDMSEAALGFCTFAGDMLGHYNVNATVPKTVMRALVGQIAEKRGGDLGAVLKDILDTAISPELKPDQQTEDIVGPYILHDFFMYYFAKHKMSFADIRNYALATFDEYDEDEIDKWMGVFFTRYPRNQFKRSSACEGANLIGFTLPYISADVNPSFMTQE